jgi:hypothetical protein
MNSKLWIRHSLTMCLMVALVATYSMVALASDSRTAGEIVVTGNSDTSFVTVNGEVAKSGRTIFSSSTISTPEGASAILNLGKAGRLELAPSTTFSLTFDDNSINGNLSEGRITVLSAAHSVGVNTANGGLIQVNAGETASASSAVPAKQTTTSSAGTGSWGWYALIIGGAVGVIVWTAAKDNENNFGGSATQVSPIR